jgi:hypothetical protein
MNNSQKPVILQRLTHFPNAPQMVRGMLTGNIVATPESVWVALAINTQEIVGQNASKEKLLEELSQKKYVVKKVVNEWN